MSPLMQRRVVEQFGPLVERSVVQDVHFDARQQSEPATRHPRDHAELFAQPLG